MEAARLNARELLQKLECDRGGCKCHLAARKGSGLTHCPAHHDEGPSLAVKEEGGRTLWNCHAGCSQEAVTAAIAELAPRQTAVASGRPKRREVAHYDYRDVDGKLLYQVVRYEPKGFNQRRPDGAGWAWGLNGTQRVLYGLPELASAKQSRRVVLVEGEKDADRLRSLGILATSYAGGAKAPWQPAWTEQLRGRKVTILVDADVPGIAKALRDAQQLAHHVAELRIVLLPDLELQEDHGDDVSDWLEAGHTVEELKAVVAASPTWTPVDVGEAWEFIFDGPVQLEALAAEPETEPPSEHGLTVRRLADLSIMPGAELQWVVERFSAIGAVTDLTAYIKVGKSTLSAQLIASVLHGEPFLGEYAAHKSPVVLFTEEPAVSLLMALTDAGVEPDDPLHLVLWSENSGRTWAQAAAAAATLCREVEAKLLVVDTLSTWAAVEDENAASEARAATAWLLTIAAQGVAVQVLRHARKSGGEIHNAGRGSGAYGGAADILLNLDYERDEKNNYEEDTTRRLLRLKSRLEREQLPPLKLDYRHGLYHLLEKPITAKARVDSLADHVVQVLGTVGDPVTLPELMKLRPARKTNMLGALAQLMAEGFVIRDGEGITGKPFRYCLADVQQVDESLFPNSGNRWEQTEQTTRGGARVGARESVPAALTGQLGNTPMGTEGTSMQSPPHLFPDARGSREQNGSDGRAAGKASCPNCGSSNVRLSPAGTGMWTCLSCRRGWDPADPSTTPKGGSAA
jgi:hypothetical protein